MIDQVERTALRLVEGEGRNIALLATAGQITEVARAYLALKQEGVSDELPEPKASTTHDPD